MLFDCFSSRIRFSPGCLTICERPISQIAWSTWESETDDACLDALFDSLPNPCSLSGEELFQRLKDIKPFIFSRLQFQTDAAFVSKGFLPDSHGNDALEIDLNTGESALFDIGNISKEDALLALAPLLAVTTPEELERAKSKLDLLLNIALIADGQPSPTAP